MFDYPFKKDDRVKCISSGEYATIIDTQMDNKWQKFKVEFDNIKIDSYWTSNWRDDCDFEKIA